MLGKRFFTTIELIVVMSIIIVMLGTTTFYYFNFRAAMGLQVCAQEIVAVLNQARSLAITKGENYKVFFDVANNSYLVKRGNTAVDAHALKEGVIIDRTTFKDNEAVFNSTGGLSDSGSVYIKNKQDKFTTIVIENTTGRIKVLNYEA
ncbi:MAG: hypothetical protein KJ893_10570 [Candidatus Omnitrophica bacterium]|nr:hypothetical protein [Candidatus Omnitrophota bacterium]MBU4478300.1 hypothetical protein [Candidatus Omnitrophota bacterium]MCG2703367.1 hypothetical protein [Candidatus Omnitrophota bacterium]